MINLWNVFVAYGLSAKPTISNFWGKILNYKVLMADEVCEKKKDKKKRKEKEKHVKHSKILNL